jgi:hypothetical protein
MRSDETRPIDTAPREEQLRLFLFCPIEGWVAGEWLDGRWIDIITWEHELKPTHWMPVPDDSPGVMGDWRLQVR